MAGFAASAGVDASSPEEDFRWSARDEEVAAFELGDLGGKTWTLASFAGKKVFVNLWATWCTPCRAELPYVQKLHEQLVQHPCRCAAALAMFR